MRSTLLCQQHDEFVLLLNGMKTARTRATDRQSTEQQCGLDCFCVCLSVFPPRETRRLCCVVVVVVVVSDAFAGNTKGAAETKQNMIDICTGPDTLTQLRHNSSRYAAPRTIRLMRACIAPGAQQSGAVAGMTRGTVLARWNGALCGIVI